jgi:hypothetical protein
MTSRTEFKATMDIKSTLKCSIVELTTVFMFERVEKNDKGNTGSRSTLPTGLCWQIPRAIKIFKFFVHTI